MLKAIRNARQDSNQKNLLEGLLGDCDRLLGGSGGSISLNLAGQALARFDQLDAGRREKFYDTLAARYNPDPKAVIDAARKYEASGTGADLRHLTQAVESPRQELMRRLNRAENGTACIVRMRQEILANKAKRREWTAVDDDLQHLLSSWFNPGFLQLQKIDWNSPASLLEKIIKHEAVHAIEGWSDLRRRMERDRRLFAFFHPALPGEPLIFVEVALVSEMPNAIAPLLEREAAPDAQSRNYKVATFYSISNCQPGLRGVNLGNFLIKRVVEALQRELPQLNRFCTLSPVPSFTGFLQSKEPMKPGVFTAEKIRVLEKLRTSANERLAALGNAPPTTPLRRDLARLCAAHLFQSASKGHGIADPVARFHLGNGARLKQINPDGDLSPKGIRESLGFMVNYSYEPGEIDANYDKFTSGEAVVAKRVKALLP